MRLLIVCVATLTLAGCFGSAQPARPVAIDRPALGLPVELSAEGWDALEAADPAGADALHEVNARWLCGYAPASLTPTERAAICGAEP